MDIFKGLHGACRHLTKKHETVPDTQISGKKKPANLRLRAESNLLKEENWRRQV